MLSRGARFFRKLPRIEAGPVAHAARCVPSGHPSGQGPGRDAGWPPAPEHAFEHASWRQARRTVLEALAAGWLVLVVGGTGAGKSLLLRELERVLRKGGLGVRLDEPGTVGEPLAPDTVRLVDRADTLDDAALGRLVLGGGATVLAVSPEAVGRVRGLSARVATALLSPLSPAEAEGFIAVTLAAEGSPPDRVTAQAIAAMVRVSCGVPGRLAAISREAARGAILEGASRVEARHVEAAAWVMRAGVEPDGRSTGGFAESMPPVRAPAACKPGTVAGSLRPARPRAWLALPALALAASGWLLFAAPSGTRGEAQRVAAATGTQAILLPPAEGPAIHPARVAPDPHAEQEVAAASVAPAEPSAGGEPPPDAGAVQSRPALFRGTTFNETLGRGGGLRISWHRAGPGGGVVLRFDASGGLTGAGHLVGHLSEDGRLVASGTLMMGRNPFATELEGRISGDQLIGAVRYTRIVEPGTRPSKARGSFRLTRA